MPWDETENEIRHRLRDPGDFKEGSFRTLTLPNGVKVVRGKLADSGEWAAQAVHFPNEKFDTASAKKWMDAHEMSEEVMAADDLWPTGAVEFQHAGAHAKHRGAHATSKKDDDEKGGAAKQSGWDSDDGMRVKLAARAQSAAVIERTKKPGAPLAKTEVWNHEVVPVARVYVTQVSKGKLARRGYYEITPSGKASGGKPDAKWVKTADGPPATGKIDAKASFNVIAGGFAADPMEWEEFEMAGDEENGAALKALAQKMMSGDMTPAEMKAAMAELSDEDHAALMAMMKMGDTAVSMMRDEGYRRTAKKRGEPVAYGDDSDVGLEFRGYSLKGVEVFATGLHNPKGGGTFKATSDYLDRMAKANTLEYLNRQMPAVTIGHDERLGDSEPRVGRVARIFRRGNKVIADFADLTKNTYEAMKKGLYNSVSLTVARGANPYVLKAALLGAAAPAVKGLKTLQDALALGQAAGEEGVFTFVADFTAGIEAAAGTTDAGQEGETMTVDEKQFVTAEQFAALTKQVETLSGDLKVARDEAGTFRDLYKSERIERFGEKLVNARKLRPADVKVFRDHASGKNAFDTIEFSEGDKKVKGSSLDEMFAEYMARGELWRAGETAEGGEQDPTKRLKPEETPEAKAEVEAGVAFAEGAGIDPEVVRKHAGPPLKAHGEE